MKDRISQTTVTVDHLIETIVKKLEANRAVLEQSIHYGRITWRLSRKGGEIEVDFEPKL
ncbi:MAG: hypothetical protein O2909_12680 [Chloroflexi bacterium]|nr:hypothetical protein [Chloroflexota bacterium]